MTATPARIAALATLRATRHGELADRALFRALHEVPARDRGWTHELAYGTLRLRGRLDHFLVPHVRRGLDRLDAEVLDILRLGVYQLVEMTSVPPYAAVSQSVELARSSGNARAAAFVNGVLQSVTRAPDRAKFPAFDDDAVGHLETWGSHPRWLVSRWVAQLGAGEAAALVEANLRRPELYLRPVGRTVGDAVAVLDDAAIRARPVDGAPDALQLLDGGIAETLAAVPAIVQDPAAGLVARFVAPPAGARLFDLCGAPGGKAIALADCGTGSRVIAADLSIGRVARLVE
ncbi:MAG: transcription antitermination factor NusB, partial [Longimicrobiales bacterium]